MKNKTTYGAKLTVTFLLVGLALLPACGKKENKQGKSSDAPHQKAEAPSTPIQLVKGAENGKWKAVKLGITDKQKNRDIIFTVDIGSTFNLPDSNLSVKVDYFVPHFKLQQAKVVSVSNKPENPAALVSITDKDSKDPKTGKELVMTGYLFARYHNDSMNHPRYNFVLLEGVPSP